ncbi:MAG: hypothetical protein Q7J07_03870 [Pelolinea sp.]|nr:hypothetical protein [Pelolinea sp.]
MVKKIIVGVVVAGISAGLIYGGIYRTIARVDNGERTSQSQEGQSNTWETSDEKGQGQGGQGGNGTNSEYEQVGIESENGFSRAQVNLLEDFADLISFNGTVTEVDENFLVILGDDGDEITIENIPWWFATDAGFFAEIGDSINVNGFYETTDEFEVSYIQNITKSIEVQIRESSGRPLWAGNGRGS